MPRPCAVARLWIALEDRLFPLLRLNTQERALYYHLCRHSRLLGRRTVRFSKSQLARATGLSMTTVRIVLNRLAEAGCVRVRERSKPGYLLELPPLRRLCSPSAAPAGRPRGLRSRPGRNPLKSPALRRALHRRERARCFYCGRSLRRAPWSLDHVVPVAAGGPSSAENLVACCQECNRRKGESSAGQFLHLLARDRVLTPAELRQRLSSLASLR